VAHVALRGSAPPVQAAKRPTMTPTQRKSDRRVL